MLYLVEGLNCSGKTTWIKETLSETEDGVIYKTPWANPLRWNDRKKKLIPDGVRISNGLCIPLIDAYAIGVYETMIEMAQMKMLDDVYWDRTFISALAYGSISRKAYDYLLELIYNIGNIEVIFLDTPVDETLERWNKIRETKPDYKNYAWADNKADAMRVQKKFYELLSQLDNHNIVIKMIR
jgi:thymidylate kinase